jgi:hypothetical protein
MNLVGMISTAVLSLTLVAAVPVFAQEQHEQEEQKSKPEAQEEKKAQPARSAKPGEKPAAQQKKNAKPEEQNAKEQGRSRESAKKNLSQPQQHAGNNGGGRIPADKFKANFGQQHTFRVSRSDYSNHRFQYGGYSFGFVDPWPSNWLYTQNVYVIEINGVYYLCNASFPGVNLVLSFTL